jgi:hypothetical protein
MEDNQAGGVIPLQDIEDVDSRLENDEPIDRNHTSADPPPTISSNIIVRLRNNPNTALVIVTFAFFVDYLLFLACVPILPLYGQVLHLTDVQIGLLFSSRAVAQVCSSNVLCCIF